MQADLAWWELVVRLLVAAALGAAMGAEREAEGRDAGLRTHLLVSLGAAVFGIISVGAWDDFVTSGTTNVRADVTRVASYVAAGIGFLGGGTIIKNAGGVRGLTTAASIWVAGGVGLAAGVGFWVPAVTGAAISLLSLVALRPLRAALRRIGSRGADLTVVLRDSASAAEVIRVLSEQAPVRPIQIRVGRGQRDAIEVVADYAARDDRLLDTVAALVAAHDDVAEVHVTR